MGWGEPKGPVEPALKMPVTRQMRLLHAGGHLAEVVREWVRHRTTGNAEAVERALAFYDEAHRGRAR